MSVLAALEGLHLLTASQAILKGALESEIDLALIAGPRYGALGEVVGMDPDEAISRLLRQHGLRLQAVSGADRTVALVRAAAHSRSAMGLVPNVELGRASEALCAACAERLPAGVGLVFLLEDDPRAAPVSCPRQAALQMGIAILEPSNLLQLRDGIEHALRLSRAGAAPVAVVVHRSILHAADTIDVRPNREVDDVSGMIIKRTAGRRPRRVETGGTLRTARRLELLPMRCIPNPGERVPVGFIVVGPADGAIMHLGHVLRLHGRVPVLQLQLISPLDEAVAERVLTRCEQIVVLEPRPGTVEAIVLSVAERLRRLGHRCGTIWGKQLPPDADGRSVSVGPDEVLHPSVLARRIIHLLHATRPTTRVARQLVPDPPASPVELLERGADIGSMGMRAELQHMLADADRWLDDGAPLEERGLPPSRIVIDHIEPVVEAEIEPARQIVCEIWEPHRFMSSGIAALRHAARDDRPWMMLVCDVGTEDLHDLERLARAVVPADRAERVRIVLGNLDDRVGLVEMIRESLLLDQLTVMIVRDGPPSRFDVVALDRAAAEVDRLGFEPKQRAVWPIEQACAFRRQSDTDDAARQRAADLPPPAALSVDRLPRRAPARLALGLRPRLEMMEVIRTRAPAQAWRRGPGSGLPQPTAVHGGQSQWRVHLAGCRGGERCPVAEALSAGGRAMGYVVRRVADPTVIGAGRVAWSQILFTRAGQTPSALSPIIPFGEADLLLGLDPIETLRAAAADEQLRVGYRFRTCAVINVGAFSDERRPGDPQERREMLQESLRHAVREDSLVVEDLAGACQSWFTTDRLTDLVMLGIAYQRGFVPLTLDALQAGLELVEDQGYARAAEAFRFGRRLAVDERLLGRPRADRHDDLRHVMRRTAASLRRRRFSGAGLADRFKRLVDGSLAAMPGLAETELGREALHDFALALRRCVIWGGIEYAERYAHVVTALYRADRGDQGRAVTRWSVLPLAEAMLIRDPPYVLAVATGGEHRRRTRLQFNVKRARDDQVERHYILRLELVIIRTRIRIELHAGETSARLIAALRHVVPHRWRGTARARDVSRTVSSLVSSATVGASSDYERWKTVMKKLHGLALSGQIASISADDLRGRVDVEPETPDEHVTTDVASGA